MFLFSSPLSVLSEMEKHGSNDWMCVKLSKFDWMISIGLNGFLL